MKQVVNSTIITAPTSADGRGSLRALDSCHGADKQVIAAGLCCIRLARQHVSVIGVSSVPETIGLDEYRRSWSVAVASTAHPSDRKSTRLNSSHVALSRMPSS